MSLKQRSPNSRDPKTAECNRRTLLTGRLYEGFSTIRSVFLTPLSRTNLSINALNLVAHKRNRILVVLSVGGDSARRRVSMVLEYVPFVRLCPEDWAGYNGNGNRVACSLILNMLNVFAQAPRMQLRTLYNARNFWAK